MACSGFAEGTDAYLLRRRRIDQEQTQTEHLALQLQGSGGSACRAANMANLLGGPTTPVTAKARKLEAVWELRTAGSDGVGS